MDCKQTQQHVDDYLDGMLHPTETAAVEQHLQGCETCRAVYDEAKGLQEMLRNLPPVHSREGFFAEALQQARAVNGVRESQRNKTRWWATGGALAASLALVATLTMLQVRTSVPTIANVQVALHQERTLDVVFDSPAEIAQVSFTMTLSDNLALANYPDKKQLQWKTSLKQGKNRLSLPVVALAEGKGEIQAVMNDGKKEKVFRMVVNVGPGKSSQLQLPEGLKL